MVLGTNQQQQQQQQQKQLEIDHARSLETAQLHLHSLTIYNGEFTREGSHKYQAVRDHLSSIY